MKRTIVMMCAVAMGIGAADAATNKVRKVLTEAEREARRERGYLRRTGGDIRREGSAKGMFVVLNAQKRVPAAAFGSAVSYMDKALRIRCQLAEAENVTVASVFGKIEAAGGTMGVGVVDDPTLPSLLTAPESRWTIVNVAKLAEGCSDNEKLAARVRKEILRSLAFTSGCAYATMADPLMRDVRKPSDLDGLQSEEFGIEISNRFPESAPLYGLKPWYIRTYREACEAGWAPAPTNEYQKAIWDQVHAVPAKPMKIEFDPKKGK